MEPIKERVVRASIVLEPIRRFLEAERLEDSAVWREATDVDDAAIADLRTQPSLAIGALLLRLSGQQGRV